MELNPLIITGKLQKNTPLCVLLFIDSFFEIRMNINHIENQDYFSQFVKRAELKNCQTVNLPLNEISQNAVRFLNPFSKEEWNLESLNSGLLSYHEFYNFRLKSDYFKMEIGEKSSENPLLLNELMLYRLCKEIGYETNLYTEIEEMKYAVENYLNSTAVKESLSRSIPFLTDSKALKISYRIENFLTEKTDIKRYYKKSVFEENIEETSEKFNDFDFVLSRIIPESENEAIILSEKRWKIYIGECLNPMFQYQLLNKFGKENYIPKNDINFLVKYLTNKNWYNTEKNWFKELLNSYNTNTLEHFCKKEGYDRKSKKNLYKSFLSQRYKITNFYFEVVPYISENRTFIYNYSLEEISSNIICMANLEKNTGHFFTVQELTLFFANKRFLSDTENIEFDKYAIEKLKNYCQSMIKKKIDNYNFSELLKIILELQENTKLIRQLPDQDIFSEVVYFFNKLIELCLIIRDSTIDIELRFQKSFDFYYEFIREFNSSSESNKQYFSNVIIITFSENGNTVEIFGEVLKSPYLEFGISLLECVDMCFDSMGSRDSSCLNSSSNWILYTSCWYLKTFKLEPKIKMSEIQQLV